MNIRSFAYLLAALNAMPLTAATEPAYVQLLTGKEYELTWNADGSLSARAAIETAKEIDLSMLTVNVADVSDKALGRPDVRDAMKVTFENAGTMVIRIPASVNLKPASYAVTLLLRPSAPAKHAALALPPRQKLTFQIIRPAADVSAAAAATIKRTRISPFGADLVVAPSVELREKSGRTGLTGLGADIETVYHQDEAIPATVLLDFSAFDPKSRRSTGTFRLAGDFPVGTSTTRVVINSPQLAAPLNMTVQIKTQRHWGFLLGAIVLGLLAGYVVRLLFAASIDRNEARLQALDLLARMNAEVARRGDAGFVDRVHLAAGVLERTLRGRTASLLPAVVAAEAELRAALDEFNQHKATRLQELDALMATIATEWHLPPKFAALIATAMEDVAAARMQTLAGNLDSAAPAHRIRSAFARDVNATAREWATSTRSELDALLARLQPVPQALKNALTANIGEAVLTLGSIETTAAGNPGDTLNAVHAAARTIRWSVNRSLEQVAAHAKEAVDVLKAASVPRATDAAEGLTAYQKTFRGERSFAEVEKELNVLLKTLREVISDAAHANAAVVADLDAGEYVKAADKATRTVSSQGTRLGGLAPAGASPISAGAPALPGEVLVSRSFTTAFVPEAVVPLDVLRVRSARDLFVAKLLRFVVSGVGISLVGFLLLDSKFIGTPSDLVTAFFWGYAADLGVDALTTAAAKVGR